MASPKDPPERRLGAGDAVLVVDVQRDFCSGGALAVPEGEAVLPVLNRWMQAARVRGVPVVASRDWHPERHPSFAPEGGPWPRHCLQDDPGAEFHPDLALPPEVIVVSKGVRLDRDQTSAFDETGLADRLHRLGVRRLFVGGLAQEVCVRDTVLDGLRLGFSVHVLVAGTRPVHAADGQRALDEMQAAGAVLEEEA